MIPKRAFLIIGTFLLTKLLYVDRACIAMAKESITGDLQLSDTQIKGCLHWCRVFQRFPRLLDGKPFETDGEDYLKNIKVQEAVYQSAESGLPVSI